MNLSTKWVVLAALLVIASAASEARAAIVAQPQGAQLTQGLVTGVHRANGQLAFRVRTGGMNNQAALAANQNGVMPAVQNARQFLVGPGTYFEAAAGMNLVPASFAALRSGQRVMVQSQGPQAIRVRIFPHNQFAARAQGMRPVGYPSALHLNHVAAPQSFAALSPMPAVQGVRTPRANHHVR